MCDFNFWRFVEVYAVVYDVVDLGAHLYIKECVFCSIIVSWANWLVIFPCSPMSLLIFFLFILLTTERGVKISTYKCGFIYF
jgi:hypothetical protein